MNNSTNSDQKKPAVFKKPASPFNNDPHNNRGGKGGNRSVAVAGGGKKMKSISVPKFKGGSGGDR